MVIANNKLLIWTGKRYEDHDRILFLNQWYKEQQNLLDDKTVLWQIIGDKNFIITKDD